MRVPRLLPTFSPLVGSLCFVGVTLSGCTSPEATVPNVGGGGAAATTAAPPTPATSSAQPTTDSVATAASCLPGNWSVDMPTFVKVFQTPGNPEYVSGQYTMQLTEDFAFSATGDDVTFRLSIEEGFVDVHNSWVENGRWAAASDSMTFEEALTLSGYPGSIDPDELSLLMAVPDSALVVLVGDSWTPGDRYGMVNGSMRTPPLSDEGGPIAAIGYVDCANETMELWVEGSGWNGNFTVNRT